MPLLDAIGAAVRPTPMASRCRPADVSMRVVADHARASTFLIADGVVPSNEWRGYVLRKIMRRAMRHGRKLGLHEPFLYSLVDVLVARDGRRLSGTATAAATRSCRSSKAEEERFDAVLTGGLPRLEEVARARGESGKVVPRRRGVQAVRQLGLPRDFIEDLAGNQGLRFDAEGFDAAMEGQREKARAGSAFDGKKGEEFAFDRTRPRRAASDRRRSSRATPRPASKDVPVLALFDATKREVTELAAGSSGYRRRSRARRSMSKRAARFPTKAGIVTADGGRSRRRPAWSALAPGLPRAHRVDSRPRAARRRDIVAAEVDAARARRDAPQSHRHAPAPRGAAPGARRPRQAGGLARGARSPALRLRPLLRVTPDELRRIERIVNEASVKNDTVNTEVRNTQEAIAAGAMALFGEKYGDKVRVVSVGDGSFSTELCGGTHVRATGDIGLFLITEESGVAAGVRRIEAVTGLGAYELARKSLDEVEDTIEVSGAKRGELAEWVRGHQQALSKTQKEVQQLKTKLALGGGERRSRGRQDPNRGINVDRATDVGCRYGVAAHARRYAQVAPQERRRGARRGDAGRQGLAGRDRHRRPRQKGARRTAGEDACADRGRRRRRPRRFCAGGRQGAWQNFRTVSRCPKRGHAAAAITAGIGLNSTNNRRNGSCELGG